MRLGCFLGKLASGTVAPPDRRHVAYVWGLFRSDITVVLPDGRYVAYAWGLLSSDITVVPQNRRPVAYV